MSADSLPSIGRWSWLGRPGVWFWLLVALGAAARGYLALATPGTEDVFLWAVHADGVSRHGLIRHYVASPLFNHPPPIGLAMARLWELSLRFEWYFPDVLRLIVSAVDLVNVALITRVLRESRWRWLAAGAYSVAPVAIVLSGEHGNTDPLIAMCLLTATLLVARRAPVRAGLVLGLSAWIKLAGLLAAPALVLAFNRTRDRIVCALVASAVAIAPLAWAMVEAREFAREHPRRVPAGVNVVWERVIAYQGLEIPVPGEAGRWVWGLRNFSARAFGPSASAWPSWVRWWHANNVAVAVALIVVFAFLRRREGTARGIATTVAGVFAIVYALADDWSTQYLAWSMPFWLLAGWRFGLAAHVTAGGYVYALYAFITDDWLLRGKSNYLTLTNWPPALLALRDVALLTFLVSSAIWFARAAAGEVAFWRARRREARLVA